MKILNLVLLIIMVSSCNSGKEIQRRLVEQKDLTIKHSHQLFQHYTNYLTLEGIEKEQAGIALLQQLKHLDSMDYDKNPIGLMTFYSFDSAGINLNYVQFQCAEYGIGWSVEIDSFLNAQNKELGIMIQQKMFKEK